MKHQKNIKEYKEAIPFSPVVLRSSLCCGWRMILVIRWENGQEGKGEREGQETVYSVVENKIQLWVLGKQRPALEVF